MVLLPEDAEDITQEILIKIITNLSAFEHRSSFQTWLFRIVKNHVLNMKKRKSEIQYYSLSAYGKSIDNSLDYDPPDTNSLPVEMKVIMDEIQIHCMIAMLLCLNRKQRLIFILGEIIGIDHNIGSKIFEISKSAFRKRLSRARNQIYRFMQERCGLVQKENVCHCKNKLSELIDKSVIDPNNIIYKSDSKIRSIAQTKHRKLLTLLDQKCRMIFQKNTVIQSPDFIMEMKNFIYGNDVSSLFKTKFTQYN